MLTLLVPILISYLLPIHQFKGATKLRLALHEYALQQLMKIGPRYPQEFKTLMSESPDMRAQLEAAVRANQQLSSQTQKFRNDAQNSARAAASASSAPVKPIIQLKTDFSNFSSVSKQ